MNLGGNVVGRPQQHARGIATGGSERVTIINPFVAFVGQGIDVTGAGSQSTGYNRHVEVNGGIVTDIDSFGMKWANVSQRCKTIGLTAIRCGYAGFVASAGDTSANETQDNQWIGCEAYDTGENGFWSGQNPAGFLILQGTTTTVPKNIRAIGCRAYDKQGMPTMVDGFRNQVPGAQGALNECIDCESEGHTSAAFNGFHFNVVRVGVNADAAIATATWTPIAFDLEAANEDPAAMHDIVTNNTRMYAWTTGYYVVTAEPTFAANATGIREARVAVNGANIARSNAYGYSDATQATTIAVSTGPLFLEAGDYVEIEVFQDSGGNLNLDASHSDAGMYKVA